jgi:hypothetical protein
VKRWVVVYLIVALWGALAYVCTSYGRDLGQWENVDQTTRNWYAHLRRPDNPDLSCCGEADAYWADQVETGPNGETIAVITDPRDDAPLGREHVAVGTRIVVPPEKIKWDEGNPTGHIVIFLRVWEYGDYLVYCYVQNGGV